MAIPTFYYSFLDRPEFKAAARDGVACDCAPAARRRSVRKCFPSWRTCWATRHQPLRNDRGSRRHEPAARWPVAVRLGRRAALRHRTAGDERETARRLPPVRSARLKSADPTCSASTGRSPMPPGRHSLPAGLIRADLGSRDAAGFLTLVGRKNDLIITNGFNVYPQVVERVINECPGVRESAVVGVPDQEARRTRRRGRGAQ